jgi:hypothetical protein
MSIGHPPLVAQLQPSQQRWLFQQLREVGTQPGRLEAGHSLHADTINE